MSSRRCVLTCVLAVIGCVSCGANVGLSDEARDVEPPADREALDSVMRKIAVIPPQPELDARAVARQVIDASGVSAEEILLAILSGETGTMSDMVLVAPLALVAPAIEPERLLQVVGPHAGNEKHRESMHLILAYNFLAHGISTPEQIAALLKSYDGPIPRGLLRVIYYRLTPGDQAELNAAVFGSGLGAQGIADTVAQIESRTEGFDKVMLTGEDRQIVLENLAILVESDEWWARRYAASVIQRYDALHTYELVGQLQNDSEPLVSEVLPPERNLSQ